MYAPLNINMHWSDHCIVEHKQEISYFFLLPQGCGVYFASCITNIHETLSNNSVISIKAVDLSNAVVLTNKRNCKHGD